MVRFYLAELLYSEAQLLYCCFELCNFFGWIVVIHLQLILLLNQLFNLFSKPSGNLFNLLLLTHSILQEDSNLRNEYPKSFRQLLIIRHLWNLTLHPVMILLNIFRHLPLIKTLGCKVVRLVLVFDLGARSVIVEVGVWMAGRRADYVALGENVWRVLLLVVEWTTTAACFYFSIHFYFIKFKKIKNIYFATFLFTWFLILSHFTQPSLPLFYPLY